MTTFENTSGYDFEQNRIALEELNKQSDDFDSTLSYSYGVLTMYSKSFACIKPAFYNIAYGDAVAFDHSESVIYFPANATIAGVESKINTTKIVYLVRYLAGGTIVNPKTGDTQPTIDNSVPVEVLLKCPKKQCISLSVEGGFAVLRTLAAVANNSNATTATNAVAASGASIVATASDASNATTVTNTANASTTAAAANNANVANVANTVNATNATNASNVSNAATSPKVVLDEDAIANLKSLIDVEIKKKGFAYFSNFPAYLLKVCGTKDVRQFASNISKFVDHYFSGVFRCETNYSYKGKNIPGVILPCDVEKESADHSVLPNKDTKIDSGSITSDFDINSDSTSSESRVNSDMISTSSPESRVNSESASLGSRVNSESLSTTSPGSVDSESTFQESRVSPESLSTVSSESHVDPESTTPDSSVNSESASTVSLVSHVDPESTTPESSVNSESLSTLSSESHVDLDSTSPESHIDSNSSDDLDHLKMPNQAPAIMAFKDSDAEELNRNYDNGQYVEFLSCKCFRRLKPSQIPIPYMEKALTAASRLIFGANAEEVHLNAFQRSLLTAASNKDLSEWNRDERYSDDILDQCLETMMFSRTKPGAGKIINQLIHKNSSADIYLDSNSKKTKGVVSRFQMARNKQTLPMYVVAAFAQDSQSGIRTLITELCRFIQDINDEAHFLDKKREVTVSLGFASVLNAILRAPYARDITFGNAAKTLVLSIFVDIYGIETLDDYLIAAFYPDEDCYHRDLIGLMRKYDSWDEETFERFVSKGPSLQLLERCVAQIWGRLMEDSNCTEPELFELPEPFIRLLSWLITFYDRATLEAVIDFPTLMNLQKIKRNIKGIMMLRSLPTIQRLADIEWYCYNLGAYVSSYLFEELEAIESPELIAYDIHKLVAEWNTISKRRFEIKKYILTAKKADKKINYGKLFKEYWQDKEREMILQQMYADELMAGTLPGTPSIDELMSRSTAGSTPDDELKTATIAGPSTIDELKSDSTPSSTTNDELKTATIPGPTTIDELKSDSTPSSTINDELKTATIPGPSTMDELKSDSTPSSTTNDELKIATIAGPSTIDELKSDSTPSPTSNDELKSAPISDVASSDVPSPKATSNLMNLETILQECLSLKAYVAFCLLYQRIKENNITHQLVQPVGSYSLVDRYQDSYVDALIQMEDFKKLIDYFQLESTIDDNQKKRYLAKVICGIFTTFHYSQKSFSFFDENFSLNDARILLQDQMTTSNFPVITSLIAIYIYQNDFFKARYLYEIFHTRAEIGNTKIYLQFRKLFDSKTNQLLQVGSEDNHYNIIQLAFYILPPRSLINFLTWASGIKIPDMVNYNPRHVHIFALNNLLKDPTSAKYWQSFMQGLSTRLTQYPVNAWMVCVCDGVLSGVWNLEHSFDVRRAYELVLTQIQDPNIRSRYFPLGLLPYITSYIIRKNNEQLCHSLKVVVEDGQLWNRLYVHNPWAKEYKGSLSAFSDYCIRKYKETKDEVYSELLKISAPYIAVENLLEAASVSGNIDNLIRQICHNYLEGNQISEIESFLSQIDPITLSYRDVEALNLLQIIYTDWMELVEREPDLFISEEDVFAFKQDCARILQYYPSLEGLKAFEAECIDIRYKRLVYSYVFGTFYNKEIYDRYSFDYNAFKHRIDQIIIARFLRKVYSAQLVYNSSYDFFYKRWRYLKLYIIMVIEADGPVDPSLIIAIMKSHHHEESILEGYFIPFKQAVDAYYGISSINAEEKKAFLYCMSLDSLADYLSEYSETLLSLSEEEKKPIRQIVSSLDYRDVSYAIFDHFENDIKAGDLQQAKGVASALVPSVFDALCQLEKTMNDGDFSHISSEKDAVNRSKKAAAYKVFRIILQKTPSKCVKAMIKLDDSRFHQYQDLINPLICSLQLPFQIYKRFRYLVLDKNERETFKRYGSLCKYLSENIDKNASTVFMFLEALKAGKDRNRKKVKSLLQKMGDNYYNIPSSWYEDADRLRSFANGETDEFHPVSNLLDASTGGRRARESYHFCITIIERLDPESLEEKLTQDDIIAAWRCYRDESGNVSEYERIIAGAQVLRAPKLFMEMAKGLGISETPDKIALDLGMSVLRKNSMLSLNADDQMEIISELVEHNLDSDILFPIYTDILRSSTCSIDCLCKHRKTIRRFVSETGYISDTTFTNLYEKILEPCAGKIKKLNNLQYSYEELYTDLSKYMDKLSVMEDSVFRRLIYSAIERRLTGIREGVRLSICVENKNNITDGYVYFSVENIGNQSVASKDYEIQLNGLPCQLENTFEMLHPEYIIGGRAEVNTIPDKGLTIQIIHENAVLSREIMKKEEIRMATQAGEPGQSGEPAQTWGTGISGAPVYTSEPEQSGAPAYTRESGQSGSSTPTRETGISGAPVYTDEIGQLGAPAYTQEPGQSGDPQSSSGSAPTHSGGPIQHRENSGPQLKNNDLYNVRQATHVYGRQQQLEELREIITAESKALIYGPSRIGKTTILDLVRDQLAVEQGNVIAVTFAGEGGAKYSDYKEIPADATSAEIEERLLVGSILKAVEKQLLGRTILRASSTSKKRLQLPPDIDENVESDICDILHQPWTIPNRYSVLNDYLEDQDLELWLILDEFQQILDESSQEGPRWIPEETGAFVSICADLSAESRIKLIICGSDDLLKHMVLKKTSIWRRILPPDTYGVKVRALDSESFKSMLRTEPLRSTRSVEDTGLTYSENALDALCRYTGGVPLYGKQIGNQVLKTLRANGDLQSRRTIYTTDITTATKVLINEQSSDKSGDIYAIYDAVTKGLSKTTDELFLSYIAQYMMNERVIGCPYNAFTQNPRGMFKFMEEGEEPYKILDDSLAIAEARGIIRKIDPEAANPCYTFCTVFYYSAFLGTALADIHLQEKLFTQEEEYEEETGSDQVVSDYHALPATERDKALTLIWRGEKDESIKKAFRDDFFPPTTSVTTQGDYIAGNKIQVNMQTITNAFTTLLTGDASTTAYLQALKDIPTLQQFLPTETLPQLTQLIEDYQQIDDEEERREAAIEIEQQTENAEQSMIGTSVAAAMTTKDFFNVTEERWTELIHVSKAELERHLPPEIVTSLGFAVMLHNVFETIRAKSAENQEAQELAERKLDYCPVAIMYCKIVESMLKELHTPIYISRLRNKTIKSANGITFEELKKADGTIDTEHKDLTIGSFAYHIVRPLNYNKDNNIDHPDKFSYRAKKITIQTITNNRNDNDPINHEWTTHALSLAVIQGVRNKSAHEIRPITQANFEWLIKTLFDEGELLRIANLAK